MIITVTLNAAVDRTVVVERLVIGKTNRATTSFTDPGGKGINVSRVVRELGYESLAMGFLAGATGRYVEAALREVGIYDDFIAVPGRTRVNTSVIDQSNGSQTMINEPGPPTELRYLHELKARLRRRLTPGSWVVLSGSLPPGLPDDTYYDLLTLCHERDAVTVLDADDAALVEGIKARPFMIKPNRSELQRLMGRPLPGDDEVLAAAREVHGRGVELVVVSLGPEGAIAVSSSGAWRLRSPEVQPVSAIGAGDSFVAGVVLSLSLGRPLEEALRLGAAAGTAAVLTPGTELCRVADVERLLPQVGIGELP